MRPENSLRSFALSLSLGLLAVMVSGPFLLPFHTEPIVSFWAEWWAVALGLAAACTGLIGSRDRLQLSLLLLVPVVLLAALLIQFALGRLIFPQAGLLNAVYLLWAGLMLILGRYLAETAGLTRLAGAIASGYAIGALISAGIALMQWLGIAAGWDWIFSNHGSRAYANVGQTNHLAHYLWLGIASCFYLRGRGSLPRPLFWLAVVPIALGSVVSGSRSVFLYPLIVFFSIAWMRRQQSSRVTQALMVDAALLLPLMIGLSYFSSWVVPYLSSAGTPSASRLYESVSGPSIRLALARTAWSVFIDRPWLGQGVGNYPWASFTASASRPGDEPFQVAENAHNVILQGLAEFGAPATAMVILVFLFWAKRFIARPWTLEHYWCGAILGIAAVHSLLEYPLWYSYFLGPIALLLGATDSGRFVTVAGRRASLYVILAGLAGAMILTNLRFDYSKIETASIAPLAADPDRERAWRISMDRLLKLHRESLLSPWVLLAFANLAEPSRQLAKERVELCERGIRFAPARTLLTRCAMQLAIAGRNADAAKLTVGVLRAFPQEQAATADELANAARVYPELAPFWQLSVHQ